MKTTKNGAIAFERACRRWQVTLGLTDWTFSFKTAKADGVHEAEVMYNCETRCAIFTYYVGVDDACTPARIALHEMLHVLLADMLSIAARRADDNHPDALREEHRVIERLLNALDGRP